jgi:hypothetical protein
MTANERQSLILQLALSAIVSAFLGVVGFACVAYDKFQKQEFKADTEQFYNAMEKEPDFITRRPYQSYPPVPGVKGLVAEGLVHGNSAVSK